MEGGPTKDYFYGGARAFVSTMVWRYGVVFINGANRIDLEEGTRSNYVSGVSII